MGQVKNERQASISLKLAQNYRVVSVAYHEASHVVAALLNHIRVEDVYIDEGKRGVGGITGYHMFYSEDKLDIIDTKIRNYLLYTEIYLKYAGLAGEKLYFKDMSGSDSFPQILKSGVEEDMQDAARIIKKYNLAEPGNKRYLFKKKMFRHITKQLKLHWPDIKLLSHILYQKRRLKEDDIKQLLLKKSPNKKFWKKQFKTTDILFTLDNAAIMRIIDKT